LRVIGIVCSLFVSAFGESGPSSDPADSTVWPNQASHANGDRWLIEHHDQIRRMNPRLLVLNFENHAPREKLDRLVDQIIAGIAEGSRYHGYNDSNAPVFLQFKAFECVELKPRYNERFERVGDEYVQAGNGGDPDQKWTGRSLRLGFVNSTRGSGCFLESLSHSIEGISTSGAIPYSTRFFAEFAGYDLRKRWGLPFDSLYALDYGSRPAQFSDEHTAIITAEVSKLIVLTNYFAIAGNAHWPPNARGHYDMDNTNAVLSTIEDWRIGSGPDGKDVAKPWSNAAFAKYHDLAPDCMGAWLVYWRQNFPGLDNKQKDDHSHSMKNWWPFLFY